MKFFQTNCGMKYFNSINIFESKLLEDFLSSSISIDDIYSNRFFIFLEGACFNLAKNFFPIPFPAKLEVIANV